MTVDRHADLFSPVALLEHNGWALADGRQIKIEEPL
jgi:hypothetical protein